MNCPFYLPDLLRYVKTFALNIKMPVITFVNSTISKSTSPAYYSWTAVP